MTPNGRMRYVIAYDITDDANRAKMATLLLGYGDRVQKSVFEADLSPADVKEILHRAANHIAADDSLRLYPLCGTCAAGVKFLGRESRIEVGSLYIV